MQTFRLKDQNGKEENGCKASPNVVSSGMEKMPPFQTWSQSEEWDDIDGDCGARVLLPSKKTFEHTGRKKVKVKVMPPIQDATRPASQTKLLNSQKEAKSG